MYSIKNSIGEIQKSMQEHSAELYFSLLVPEWLIPLVPEELHHCPLEEVEKKVSLPYGLPFIAEVIVDAANIADAIVMEHRYDFIPLWRENTGDYIPKAGANNKESVFLVTIHEPVSDKRPAVIICPGGGYEMVAMNGEGIQVAEKMEELGYRAFVLNYRVAPNQYPEPHKDVALAIKYVRANAEYFHVDPDNLLLMGFSAGGHLCASGAALYPEIENVLMEELEAEYPPLAQKYRCISIRPDQLSLNYPVISFSEDYHKESFLNLTGGREQLRKKLSVEYQVTERYPKTFLWACEDDDVVPISNAKRMYEALKSKGVPCKLVLYPSGGHGCCLAEGTSAEGWVDEMHQFMKS